MSRIRADKLVNRLGTGGPKFPHGVAEGFSVTGIVTATSFKKSDGTEVGGVIAGINTAGISTFTNLQVSGNATVTGNLTVNGTTTTIDTVVTAVDSLAVDGQITAGSGINITGVATATSFVGDGSGLTGVSSWDSYDGWLFGGGC